MWLNPFVLSKLIRLRADVLITPGFNLWTLFGVVLKVFAKLKIVVLWDGISPSIARLDNPFSLGLRRLLGRFCNAAICNTEEAYEYLRATVKMPRPKLLRDVFTVPDAATLSAGGNSHLALGGLPRPVFLFVGQLIERKGPRYLLEAARLLVRRGLSHFSLVLVGDGVQAKELRSLASDLGLNGIVNFVGPMCYQKLGAYFSACDVFVFPTLEDTWGVVVLEAMAFAKPIICSKYAGASELVKPDENGFLVDPHNPDELARSMERFLREPGLAQRLGAKSKDAVAGYTPYNSAQTLASLIVSEPESRIKAQPTEGLAINRRA
jgi:glycosyltransferase involved in cell wall biosynthesis